MRTSYVISSTVCRVLTVSIVIASSAMAQGDYRGGGMGRTGSNLPGDAYSTPEVTWDPSALNLHAHMLGAKGDILSPSDPGGTISVSDARMRIDVQGIQLIDPAITNGIRRPGHGHLLYRVDRQPIVATAATDLAFRNLDPGPHEIDIMLVTSDFMPLGPQQQIRVIGVDAASPRTESRNPKAASSAVPKELRNTRLKARLVSMDERAAMHEALVEIDVTGLPAAGTARMTKAPLILYRVDDGPVIATSERRMSFHQLDPGEHTITVALETADHIALGPKQTLHLRVPEYGSAANY